MIKVANLQKDYALSKSVIVPALRGVTFNIDSEEVAALIGPSGSGKSTLLNVLGGLDREYSGSVKIDEKDILSYDANYYRRFIVGTIFQQFYLIPSLNVYENVTLPNSFSSKRKDKSLKERADYLLEMVGLSDRKYHKPKELSGGQAQRVAIARALISSPKIVLADEPTGNLDTKTGQEIIDLLFKINDEEHTTLVIVTHDTDISKNIKKKIHLRDGLIEDK